MTDTLTITQAGYLADLIRGVEAGAKMRWYLDMDRVDYPMTVVLRAFTDEHGNLYSHVADIRDAHVWTSGMFEHWFPVRDVLAAMANAIDGSEQDKPMAFIDEEGE